MIVRLAIALLCGGSCLPSCRLPVATEGLRPIAPAVTSTPQRVESLRPTLRWEALPMQEFTLADGAQAHDVRYDLRIRRTQHPLELVYTREGLPVPHHRVESDLEANTEYAWEVRARFRLDGEERVSPWAASTRGWRSAVLPAPSPWRFKTPRAFGFEGESAED